MKRFYLLFTSLALLAAVPLYAAPPAGTAQSFIAFTGGSIWNSQSTGTCVWYFPVLSDLPLTSLFATDQAGNPVIDTQHAYFLWVSDWSIQGTPFTNSGFGGATVTLAVLPAGKATIYYSPNPTSRDLRNPGDPRARGSWGTPIATFVRGGGLFQSPDGFVSSDKFYFSALLLESKNIVLNGKPFNFRDLMPHGMTCFEYGQSFSTTETGSCVAMGN